MKRTQIQLDGPTYNVLRRKAFDRGGSISSYAREILARALGTAPSKRRRGLQDFHFIGAGASRQDPLAPISERHDEALADALSEEHRR